MNHAAKEARTARIDGIVIVRNIFLFLAFMAAASFLLLLEGEIPEADPKRIEMGLYEAFWQTKLRSRRKADVVFLGDSRVNQGISPGHFTAELPGEGWTGRNLGFNSGGLNPVMFEFAEARLDFGSPRRPIVVMGVSPGTLTRQGSKNEYFESLKKRPWLNAQAYMLFPRLMGALSKRDLELEIEFFAGQNEYLDSGWQAAQRVRDLYPDAWLNVFERLFKKDHVREEIQRVVMEQTRSWTERGVLVVAFRPPTSPRMRQLEAERSQFDEASFAAEFSAHGGLWIPLDPDDYPTYDNSHLAKPEAMKLSKYLGRAVATHLSKN